MSVEDRVGALERETARHGEQLGHLSGEVSKIGVGVERLLDRDARRPSSLTWQVVAGTCGGIAATASVVWWLIGASPAVTELDRRLSRLDDPEVGRVPRLEKHNGWAPRVQVSKGR